MNPRTGNLDFSMKSGTHLFNSRANKREVIINPAVKINYGATRVMKGADGKRHVFHYVWGTDLKNGERASGWIRRSALNDRPKMPTLAAKRPPSGAVTPYTITGGNPQSTRFGFRDSAGQFHPYKVTKGYTGGGREVTDYLGRPGGYVNQNFNLPGKGGVSYDTYRTGTTFLRSRSVPAVKTPFYYPGGTKRVGSLTFVYGTVQTPTGARHGWIPSQALGRRP